jgi:hypothetical protein
MRAKRRRPAPAALPPTKLRRRLHEGAGPGSASRRRTANEPLTDRLHAGSLLVSIALSAALSELLDDLSKARPVVDLLSIATFPEPIPVMGPGKGFVYHLFDEFPEELRFTIVGEILRPDRLQAPASDVSVGLTFETEDNPGLQDRIELSAPVGADWRFAFEVAATFTVSGARRLGGTLKVSGGLQAAADEPVVLEIPTLDWLFSTVGTSADEISPRELIARMRRVALPSILFDLVTGLVAAVSWRPSRPKLFAAEPVKQKRFAAGMRQLRVDGRNINLSHVLTGIEGGRRLDPRPRLGPINVPQPLLEWIRPETLLTWAGDVAKPLQQIAMSRYFAQYYRPGKLKIDANEQACLAMATDAQRIACLYPLSASTVDLLGDIDGVNLAAVYDPAQPLSELLNGYYSTDSRRRFALFLERTRPWGSNIGGILASEAGVGPDGQPRRRLTADSRAWMASEISAITRASIFTRLLEALRGNDLTLAATADFGAVFGRIFDADVMALTAPDGLQVQQLTSLFAEFVEQGLNEESPLT